MFKTKTVNEDQRERRRQLYFINSFISFGSNTSRTKLVNSRLTRPPICWSCFIIHIFKQINNKSKSVTLTVITDRFFSIWLKDHLLAAVRFRVMWPTAVLSIGHLPTIQLMNYIWSKAVISWYFKQKATGINQRILISWLNFLSLIQNYRNSEVHGRKQNRLC